MVNRRFMEGGVTNAENASKKRKIRKTVRIEGFRFIKLFTKRTRCLTTRYGYHQNKQEVWILPYDFHLSSVLANQFEPRERESNWWVIVTHYILLFFFLILKNQLLLACSISPCFWRTSSFRWARSYWSILSILFYCKFFFMSMSQVIFGIIF